MYYSRRPGLGACALALALALSGCTPSAPPATSAPAATAAPAAAPTASQLASPNAVTAAEKAAALPPLKLSPEKGVVGSAVTARLEGLRPGQESELVGRTLRVPKRLGELVLAEDVD